MPTQNAPPWRPWKPWKILLAGVLGCAFAFAVVVGVAVYSVGSRRAHKVVTVEQVVAQRPRQRTARPMEPGLVPHHRDDLEVPGLGNNLTNRPDSVSLRTTKLVRNAILGFRETNGITLAGDDLFKDAVIAKLQIDIPPQGIASLNRSARKYVRATIQEGERLYTNVAIHLKGGPGSYRDMNDFPGFTVNFDRFAAGQTFHGLKKIHLNNSVQDKSYLSEKICRELFEAAGVPAPRAGNAKVTFNGHELGIYVLVEGINKQFLKRYFKDAKGNVYDGHSGTDVTDNLPTNSGENPGDKSRLRALASAARQTDLDARLASLEKTLDLDRFLSFMAMEVILCHWDGYTMNRNNFRIFHDRDSDRMVFFPQGVDQMLSRPHGAIFPPAVGLVARSVLEIPEARRRYRERVAQLSTNVFRVDAITDRVHEVAANIEAVLDESDPQAANSHRQRAAGFCRRVQQRASYLRSQISPASATQLGDLAIAAPSDWQSRQDLGEANLAQENENGKTVLRISTKEGCTASWRTTKLLESGKYRFEARIKTRGVVLDPGDPRAGAGLRISRHRAGQKNSGDHDWTPVAFDFEVHEQAEVELVCELRASQGDLWFDLESLKLNRR